jgi:uncharacterized membrane protein
MRTIHRKTLLFLLLIGCLFVTNNLVAQHDTTHAIDGHEHSIVYIALEWIEYIVDLFGIGILLLGFVKGIFLFGRLELERMRGEKDADDIFALRSTIGGYIILALDFLIISDIIHSVIKPDFNELINLGIIVVLRTSIGFFLGRELMELRHLDKETEEAEH